MCPVRSEICGKYTYTRRGLLGLRKATLSIWIVRRLLRLSVLRNDGSLNLEILSLMMVRLSPMVLQCSSVSLLEVSEEYRELSNNNLDVLIALTLCKVNFHDLESDINMIIIGEGDFEAELLCRWGGWALALWDLYVHRAHSLVETSVFAAHKGRNELQRLRGLLEVGKATISGSLDVACSRRQDGPFHRPAFAVCVSLVFVV